MTLREASDLESSGSSDPISDLSSSDEDESEGLSSELSEGDTMSVLPDGSVREYPSTMIDQTPAVDCSLLGSINPSQQLNKFGNLTGSRSNL